MRVLNEKNDFKKRLEELGYTLSDEDFERAFIAYKKLKDRKVISPVIKQLVK